MNGFIVAAPRSGSGKSTVTLGLLGALRNRGLRVRAFKCGPDFIDPTLHRVVTGETSWNLDIAMCGRDYTADLFRRYSEGADIVVVEGVMGLFDGGTGSTAELAKTLGLPVVLVVDAGGMAESAAALVAGFADHDPELALAGVIFNRVGGERHETLLREAVAAFTSVPVLGVVPKNRVYRIPHRHLGLVMGHEAAAGETDLENLARTVADAVDLDRLTGLEIPAAAPGVARRIPAGTPPRRSSDAPVIAVARDEAFCFCYEDNLELFRAAGARIEFFSPLTDRELPPATRVLYLPGGYPELYAERLSANHTMLRRIKAWCDGGGPTWAECGGFMTLSKGIVDFVGRFFPMAGFFPVRSRLRKGRVHLGYREITLTRDCLFGPAGRVLRGHEFHYSDIDAMPEDVERVFSFESRPPEGYRIKNTIGTYVHLHFGGTPDVPRAVIGRQQPAGDEIYDAHQGEPIWTQ